MKILRSAMMPLLLLAPVTSAHAQTLTPRDIAARARPAVVLIQSIIDGEVAGLGSGFIVTADGQLVTNRHVIEGAQSLRVQLASGEIYDRVFVISDDERRDLAILRIPGASLPVLPLGDDQTAQVGDAVYAMGSPLGLDGTFSDGLLSARRTVDGVMYLQISAPISKGSSGGPVMNAKGEVIGIATSIMRDGQNLNVAMPARYAAGMLAMGEAPVAFESVASRFTATTPAAGSQASMSDEADEDEEDEEPAWRAVLREEVKHVMEFARQQELTLTHDTEVDLLADGESETYTLEYEPNTEITLVGVCDIDCSDLDLTIHDPTGKLITRDVETDDRPVLEFNTKTFTGGFKLTVTMADCGTATCGFAIMSFSGK